MKYPYKAYQTQVERHVFWVAESLCLKGCVGQGDTINKAITELEENETVWIETAKIFGIEIPSVKSGKKAQAERSYRRKIKIYGKISTSQSLTKPFNFLKGSKPRKRHEKKEVSHETA